MLDITGSPPPKPHNRTARPTPKNQLRPSIRTSLECPAFNSLRWGHLNNEFLNRKPNHTLHTSKIPPSGHKYRDPAIRKSPDDPIPSALIPGPRRRFILCPFLNLFPASATHLDSAVGIVVTPQRFHFNAGSGFRWFLFHIRDAVH